MKIKKTGILFLLVFSLILGGCSAADMTKDTQADKVYKTKTEQGSIDNSENASQKQNAKKLKVHFINVGQGSSTLVESNGHYMLIDGGDRDYSTRVVAYLKKRKVKTLDYVIATHYDADHLNGVVGAISAFKVKKVIAPDYTTESKVYTSFIEGVKSKNLSVTYPQIGKKYNIGNAKFTILAPNDTHYDDENDFSVAIKLVNGKNSFVITGDAGIESEYEMLETGINLSCDVYVAGHHGSRYSSSEAFLQAMKPKSVVVSAGKGNKYGHPSEEALARFKAMKCKLYRTDKSGDIIATSDGKKITFSCKDVKISEADMVSAESEKGKYIGNINSKKYHTSDCSSLPYEQNRVYFKSKEEAEAAGYEPCGLCRP